MNRFQKCVLGILTAASLTFAWRGQAQLTQVIPFTYPCQVRLTLTTGTPVTTADVTGASATNVFVTPVAGGYCGFYSGTSWAPIVATEQTVAVPATTSQMYDVFCYNSSSTMACDAALAWTNDTTRATALVAQNGVLSKTGDLTRRYVGSFRTTTVSGQTEDSVAKRYVYSYYNRVSRPMRVVETAVNWTYTLVAFHQANANAVNQLDMVIGVSEDIVEALVLASSSNGGAAGTANMAVGIGLDSTTTNATGVVGSWTVNGGVGAAFISTPSANWRGFPGAGRHTLVWLEESTASNTTTWYGTNGSATVAVTGISGTIRN